MKLEDLTIGNNIQVKIQKLRKFESALEDSSDLEITINSKFSDDDLMVDDSELLNSVIESYKKCIKDKILDLENQFNNL
jgi:7,8-dihydro-6-hydroxymethylpterin-pyrophosphokinase